jgi:hypothetical protein
MYFYGKSQAMNITGILKIKKDEQVVSDKFRKREFVVTDNSSQYPQHISFQCTQDRCSLLDSVNAGDTITVHFNLRGREWTSPQGEVKYFNTLEAWKIDRGTTGQSSQPAYEMTDNSNDKDDLPF